MGQAIPDNARLSSEVMPGNPGDYESEETTHFSVVDKDGNVVSNTYTLNFSFGTGLMAEGTGIILNNEMADFSAKPGVPNAFGSNRRRSQCCGTRKTTAEFDDTHHRYEGWPCEIGGRVVLVEAGSSLPSSN